MSHEVVHNFRECELFHWIHRMQKDCDNLKRGLESEMTDNHVKVLDKLHFSWTRSQKDHWDKNINLLVDFQVKNDHCNIPQKGRDIGQCVQGQQSEYTQEIPKWRASKHYKRKNHEARSDWVCLGPCQ